MALTPCRECGHVVSSAAAACPNCGAKPKRKSMLPGLLLIMLLLISLPSLFVRCETAQHRSTSPSRWQGSRRPVTASAADAASRSGDVGLGQIGLTIDAGDGFVLAGSTYENYKRMVQLCVAKDEQGIAQMVSNGSAFVVLADTRVKVIDHGIGSHEVRILGGMHEGKSAVVSVESIRPE